MVGAGAVEGDAACSSQPDSAEDGEQGAPAAKRLCSGASAELRSAGGSMRAHLLAPGSGRFQSFRRDATQPKLVGALAAAGGSPPQPASSLNGEVGISAGRAATYHSILSQPTDGLAAPWPSLSPPDPRVTPDPDPFLQAAASMQHGAALGSCLPVLGNITNTASAASPTPMSASPLDELPNRSPLFKRLVIDALEGSSSPSSSNHGSMAARGCGPHGRAPGRARDAEGFCLGAHSDAALPSDLDHLGLATSLGTAGDVGRSAFLPSLGLTSPAIDDAAPGGLACSMAELEGAGVALLASCSVARSPSGHRPLQALLDEHGEGGRSISPGRGRQGAQVRDMP